MTGRLHSTNAAVLFLNFRTQRPQMLQHHTISLNAVRRQPVHGHILSQGCGTQKHCCLGVVPGKGTVLRTVALMSRNHPSIRRRFVHLNTAVPECTKGHLNVACRFHRRLDCQCGLTFQQRQGKQQAGNKLAGHIARQHVSAGLQVSCYMELRCPVRADAHTPACALGHKQIPIHIHGPLTQPSMHAEDTSAALRHSNRHKKTQRGAAFPAIHHGTDSFFSFRSPNG